jgi:uncharacterized protein (TIGR02145 family)/uncharacterized repeat protein (TIGR02543 family)
MIRGNMKKVVLRVILFAVIAALVCVGCTDDGGTQNKSSEVGEFVNMFVGGGAQYTLSVDISPIGGGNVSRKPDCISCKAGSKVTVTATAAIGYRFGGWTGDVNVATDSVTITMSKNMALKANFIDIYKTPYTLTVNSEPNNGGSVSYNPVKVTYNYGDSVTVTAIPADIYEFVGWSGASTSTEPVIRILMDNHKTLTAKFVLGGYTLITDVSPSGGGTVSCDPYRPNYYLSGTNVTVTAEEAFGYRFTGWSGASTSTDKIVNITMDENKTLTANFQPWQFSQLDIMRIDGGEGTVLFSPNQPYYNYGTSVTVTATATDGYEFMGWTCWNYKVLSTYTTMTITLDSNYSNQCGNMSPSYAFFASIIPGISGTFTDNRNDQIYKTTKIGNQTWMAENLNYEISGSSWCYKDSNSYCDKYGRLYDWYTAMTACPSGWHLPSNGEWYDLVRYAGGADMVGWAGKRLKATVGWNAYNGNSGNGTDNYGFSALPGGNGGYWNGDSRFDGTGEYGFWWMATEFNSSNAYFMEMRSYNDYVLIYGNSDTNIGDKSIRQSVRCVKD